MNKIEELKARKDGLDVGADIPRYAELGLNSIEEGDLERLKWWGVFFRKQTPGYFMMRLRIPNGVATAAQFRAIGGLANRVGRGLVDITTRQQVQLRWIRVQDVPEILDRLLDVGLVTLQTGMDNIAASRPRSRWSRATRIRASRTAAWTGSVSPRRWTPSSS